MRLISIFLLFWSMLVSIGTPLYAQTSNKSTDLKASPANDSKVIKSIPAGTALKLSKREGFWVEVEAGGTKGWVKLSDVTMGQGPAGGLGVLDTGRAGKSNVVSTSAARGLSAKELVAATPDLNEFENLKKLSVTSQDAEQFSKEGGLATRSMPLLASAGAPTQGKAKKKNSDTGAKRKKPEADSHDDDDDDDAAN
jgi:hypothetical protein